MCYWRGTFKQARLRPILGTVAPDAKVTRCFPRMCMSSCIGIWMCIMSRLRNSLSQVNQRSRGPTRLKKKSAKR